MKKLYLLLIYISPLLLHAQSKEDIPTWYSYPMPTPGKYDPNPTSARTLLYAQPNTKIVLRCISTINLKDTTREPLVVVDNYPVEGSIKDLNLNPAQIKSITILKDAAAAVLWGCRAGNGVIIIYTNKMDSVKTSARQVKVKQINTTADTRRKAGFVAANAARGKFSIYLSNNTGPFNLSLINMQGQILRTWKNSNSPGNLHEFDITGVPAGVYIASLQARGRNMAQKIWINR